MADGPSEPAALPKTESLFFRRWAQFVLGHRLLCLVLVGLVTAGSSKEGASYFSRLIKSFPGSKYLPDSYFQVAEYYFNNCLHTHPRWTQPPGYVTEETARRKIFSQVQEAARRGQLSTSALSELQGNTFEDMVERGFVVIGSPDEVADKLREIVISQNVGNLLLIPQFGNMDLDTARYNTELLGKRVKPQIEGIFANEWEHHWWPKKLKSPARPAELSQ